MAPAKRAKVPSDAPRRRSERTATKKSSAAEESSLDAQLLGLDDEEEEATSSAMADQWLFDIKAKLDSPTFDHPDLIQKLDPKDFNLEYVKKTGLITPLFFDAPPTELGMKMPKPARFGVNEVKKLVTPEREIEVVVVKTQTSQKMTMHDFANYYKKKAEQRKNLLNVLSLEFSLTPLEEKVHGPELIKSIDWVELYWPKALRKRQEYLTNPPADVSTYPKVQNYCLMSVSDCYTDFHIDFGGTSVWYHVLKGEKIFFMIEPTEQNIKVYEGWTLSGSDQNKTFFGDIVVKCARVRLVAGNTFVIPSGWIHAVYTAADSLVFGGNFLHSYAIPMQLRVYQSESTTHVRKRYRYPYFIQTLWYVAERLVRRATGRCYLAEISSELPVVQPTVRSTGSLTSSADSQLNDPDYVAADDSLMDTSADSFVVVDEIGSEKKATSDADSKQLSQMSVLERSQASMAAGECSPPPQLERADSQERKTNVGDMGGCEMVPGERLPFVIGSPAFSSASEGEDNRKPPPTIEPFSPSRNVSAPIRQPFTPADKFDDSFLTALTSFERDGINALMQFLMKLTEKNREVGEGIFEPDHILKDLQCTFTRACELMSNQPIPSISADQSQGPVDQENSEKPTVADPAPKKKSTPPPSSRKSPVAPKRPRLSADGGAPSASSGAPVGPKKPKKKKPSDAKEKSLTPPPPVVPAKFHGFDPMTELVALGHKPLPTAFRMGPNMAAAPSTHRPALPRPKSSDSSAPPEVSSSDLRSQISPSLDGRQPSTPTEQSTRPALPIVHRHTPQQLLQDASWSQTPPAIRGGDPRRQAALHQQQLLRAAMTAESTTANHGARSLPHPTTSFGLAQPLLRQPYHHASPSITSPSHMLHQHQQFGYPSYRPGVVPQPVPQPVPPPTGHSSMPTGAPLFAPVPHQLAVSVDGAASLQQLDGQQRSRQLPSPHQQVHQQYTPLNQGPQRAPPMSPYLSGVPSPSAITSQQPQRFIGGFFAPPPVTSSKRQSLSAAEQFPMGPPKLMIPQLATTQPSAAGETTGRPRKSPSTTKEEEMLEGPATINALDELTRALKNEPSKEEEAEAKVDAPEEEATVDPLSWADELASLTQVMTEN